MVGAGESDDVVVLCDCELIPLVRDAILSCELRLWDDKVAVWLVPAVWELTVLLLGERDGVEDENIRALEVPRLVEIELDPEVD